MTKVINLFGGPGVRKSTVAAGIFHLMKMSGQNVELVGEYAKDLTWERRHDILKDQLYVTAKQNRRLDRLRGQVDYIISDSPLLLGIFYAPDSYYRCYPDLVREVFDSYDNINFFLRRNVPYNPAGRSQTEEQAKQIDIELEVLLRAEGYDYTTVVPDEHTAAKIVNYLREMDNND